VFHCQAAERRTSFLKCIFFGSIIPGEKKDEATGSRHYILLFPQPEGSTQGGKKSGGEKRKRWNRVRNPPQATIFAGRPARRIDKITGPEEGRAVTSSNLTFATRYPPALYFRVQNFPVLRAQFPCFHRLDRVCARNAWLKGQEQGIGRKPSALSNQFCAPNPPVKYGASGRSEHKITTDRHHPGNPGNCCDRRTNPPAAKKSENGQDCLINRGLENSGLFNFPAILRIYSHFLFFFSVNIPSGSEDLRGPGPKFSYEDPSLRSG